MNIDEELKQAARYRWLRRWCPISIMVHGLGLAWEEIAEWTDEEIDAAIDAAMKGK